MNQNPFNMNMDELVHESLEKDFPTPPLISAMIEDNVLDPHGLSRIVLQAAHYSFGDTSDMERSKHAFLSLVKFLGKIEAIAALGIEQILSEAMSKAGEDQSFSSTKSDPVFGRN